MWRKKKKEVKQRHCRKSDSILPQSCAVPWKGMRMHSIRFILGSPGYSFSLWASCSTYLNVALVVKLVNVLCLFACVFSTCSELSGATVAMHPAVCNANVEYCLMRCPHIMDARVNSVHLWDEKINKYINRQPELIQWRLFTGYVNVYVDVLWCTGGVEDLKAGGEGSSHRFSVSIPAGSLLYLTVMQV